MAKSRSASAHADRPAKSGVAVVGSLNMGLVVKTETIPLPGQMVIGRDVLEVPGGKGANEAAAAGRLGARRPRAGATPTCRLVGRVGDDFFGQRMLEALRAAHVETAHVMVTRKVPTGVAMITVDRHGEHASVVACGANARLAATDLLAQRKAIEQSAVMTVQLETPFETVACAIALAKQAGTLTILDPAPIPAEGVPESLFHVDILCPNQHQAYLLTGIVVRTTDDARRAGERMLARGARHAVIRMGAAGAVLVTHQAQGSITAQHISGFKVPVCDTMAAGDCFVGAMAVALAEGLALPQAIRFANAAGALACTRPGAQAALPTRGEVDALVASKPQ